ncbi:MAG: PQQ-dependent sugar dehydrogenase [Thermoleophilaceae bacterium]
MRVHGLLIVALLSVAAVAAGCGGAGADADEVERPRPPRQPATASGAAEHFGVEQIAQGLNRPTFVAAAPGDGEALWVLEQPGRVVRVAGGSREVVLDLGDEVTLGGEQGLLGIAFHPDFASDPRLYLHWSGPAGATRVAELRMRPDGTVDPDRRRYLLRLPQPEENHNGGQLAFGPDGRLYLGLGDGGGAFDPEQRAQDLDDLHGKLVSTDVDAPHARWRVELYGLRNPWRFSFDPALSELWLADVGQDEVEEVNRVLLEPDEPPKNLGWGVFEGTDEVRPGHRLDRTGALVWPVAVYDHDDGCSITGGQLYRGAGIPALAGRYVYGDFCSGTLWSLEPAPGGGATDVRRERATVPQLTHIGRDADGGLVFASATGALYRAVAPQR